MNRLAYMLEREKGQTDFSNASFHYSDMTDMRFVDANFENADFSCTEVEKSKFICCNLRRASFYQADLGYAEFVNCDLSDADLTATVLKYTRFDNCILTGTCLDPDSPISDEGRAGIYSYFPVEDDGTFVAYRTSVSQHVGRTVYTPGETHIAPIFSTDMGTGCHPGLFFNTLDGMERNYPASDWVKVRVNIKDAMRTNSGKFRCRQFEVLEYEKES